MVAGASPRTSGTPPAPTPCWHRRAAPRWRWRTRRAGAIACRHAAQLSPDRDPQAPHARPPRAGEVDLRSLLARGLLRALPPRLLETPPRIAAETAVERAALGYLHANCSHCHHDGEGRVPVRLNLAQSAADPVASRRKVLRSTLEAPSRWRAHAGVAEPRIVLPGDVSGSVLAQRLASREPRAQMPPLGTEITDPEGLALVHRWISQTHPPRKEPAP
jgi:hypothetical protein